MLKGIDSASVAGNKKADWVKARAVNGFSFALLRASYAHQNYGIRADGDFAKHYAAAKAAGYVVGAYHFWRVDFDPLKQAEVFVKTVQACGFGPGDLLAWNDLEFGSKGRKGYGYSVADALARYTQCSNGIATGLHLPKAGDYSSERVWREDLQNVAAPAGFAGPGWMVGRYKQGQLLVAKPWVRPTPTAADNVWIIQKELDKKGVVGFLGNVDINEFVAMSKGETGPRVQYVQARLGLPQTGKFDAAMGAAVGAYQQAHHLVADQIIGPRTFGFLAWER